MSVLGESIGRGRTPGVILGAAWVAYELFDRFEKNSCPPLAPVGMTVRAPVISTAELDLFVFVLLIALCSWAAIRAACQTSRIDTGILTAVATSVISSLIATGSFVLMTALSVAFGPDAIERCDIIGPATMFIMGDAWWPVFVAPVLSLAFAAGVGTVGGIIGRWYGR